MSVRTTQALGTEPVPSADQALTSDRYGRSSIIVSPSRRRRRRRSSVTSSTIATASAVSAACETSLAGSQLPHEMPLDVDDPLGQRLDVGTGRQVESFEHAADAGADLALDAAEDAAVGPAAGTLSHASARPRPCRRLVGLARLVQLERCVAFQLAQSLAQRIERVHRRSLVPGFRHRSSICPAGRRAVCYRTPSAIGKRLTKRKPGFAAFEIARSTRHSAALNAGGDAGSRGEDAARSDDSGVACRAMPSVGD